MAIPNTIDEYIAGFPKDIQQILTEIRTTINAAFPELTETISYAIPTFKFKGKNLIHFAAFKNHIGLYATPDGHEAFAADFSKRNIWLRLINL